MITCKLHTIRLSTAAPAAMVANVSSQGSRKQLIEVLIGGRECPDTPKFWTVLRLRDGANTKFDKFAPFLKMIDYGLEEVFNITLFKGPALCGWKEGHQSRNVSGKGPVLGLRTRSTLLPSLTTVWLSQVRMARSRMSRNSALHTGIL